jgi:IMP dehydrogenase
MKAHDIKHGFTFDDLILIPARSAVLPNQVDVNTRLSRNINLNIPIVSAHHCQAGRAGLYTQEHES